MKTLRTAMKQKTTFTDAWDTLYIGMCLFPVDITSDDGVSVFI